MYGGMRNGVGRKWRWTSDVAWYGCRTFRVTAKSAMKVARSDRQGGCSATSKSSSRRPRTRISTASSRRSWMLASRRHDALLTGSPQTVPFQPASCQGTRTDRCRSGSLVVMALGQSIVVLPERRRAPSAVDSMSPGRRASACHAVAIRAGDRGTEPAVGVTVCVPAAEALHARWSYWVVHLDPTGRVIRVAPSWLARWWTGDGEASGPERHGCRCGRTALAPRRDRCGQRDNAESKACAARSRAPPAAGAFQPVAPRMRPGTPGPGQRTS